MNIEPRRFQIPECDKVILPRVPDFCDIGVSDFTREILTSGGREIIPNKPKSAATELDIFSFKGLSIEELKNLINSRLNIDISSPEGIKKIADLHARAILFYSEMLFRVSSPNVSQFKFRTESDVIKFMSSTMEGQRRQTYCNIIKIMFLLSEQDNAETLKDLDLKSRLAIRDHFIPVMQVEDIDFPLIKNSTYATITESIEGENKTVRFKIRFRAKSDRSNIMKMGYNPEYYSTDLVGDSIGIEFEVDDPMDLLFVHNFFYKKVFKSRGKSNIKYSDKNILELTTGNRDFPIEDELFKLLGGDNLDTDSKPQTGVTYRDLKSTVQLPVSKNPNIPDSQKTWMGFEFRGVLVGNKNNSGLADHRIYDFFKRISFMIRLQGYVTEEYVKHTINKFYETFPEASFAKENILEHYLGALMKIYIGSKKKVYYTTQERYETLSQRKDLYPQGIIPGNINSSTS